MRIKLKTIAAGVLIIGAICGYGFFIEPYALEVQYLGTRSAASGSLAHDLTAVFLTDLHIDQIGKREKAVLAKLDQIEPDLIFLGGDYITWQGEIEPAIRFLNRLQAPLGVWAVMGDYDYSRSRQSCLFCHRQGTGAPSDQHRVRFLRNSTVAIPTPKGVLTLAGVDRQFHGRFVAEQSSFTAYTQTFGKADVVLSHDPMAFDDLEATQALTVLAGDTHGGQIPLPAWAWRLMGYTKNARYNQGWFRQDRKQMYVSRGIGTSHWPFRLLRRPEIVVLQF
jgi:predicted MPP superfamily phosphohydrolase